MTKKVLQSLAFVFAVISSKTALAQDSTWVESVNDSVNTAMGPITDVVVSVIFYSIAIGDFNIPFVLVWLIVGAIVFTVKMNFINIKGFKTAIDIVKGVYSNPDEKEAGQVSHFQALTTALSGTVGLGNIAGVAVAVGLGGPGATFWMIFAGLLGMSSKFVECTLGVKYREEKEDGSVSGGPMYYLSRGLAGRKWLGMDMTAAGKVLAGFFALMCVGGSLGGGNMFQVNQARAQFMDLPFIAETAMNSNGGNVVFGIVMALLVAVVIIGGIQSIAKVTDKIVPFMCGLYVLSALVVLVVHVADIPSAFGAIFAGAFAPEAIYGGIVGVMIQGFKRAAFSNEAGIGSASIAHSAVKTKEPVTEGLVSMLEPFIDTVVVCTMTALVLVITGVYQGEAAGVAMTSLAFESVFGGVANVILSIAVLLFAFSTMISWSYYGQKSWAYLFGDSKAMDHAYKLLFCLTVVIGAILSLGKVVDFSDSMIFAMCFPNIFGLYLLSGEVKGDLNSFFARVKSGEIKRYK